MGLRQSEVPYKAYHCTKDDNCRSIAKHGLLAGHFVKGATRRTMVHLVADMADAAPH